MQCAVCPTQAARTGTVACGAGRQCGAFLRNVDQSAIQLQSRQYHHTSSTSPRVYWRIQANLQAPSKLRCGTQPAKRVIDELGVENGNDVFPKPVRGIIGSVLRERSCSIHLFQTLSRCHLHERGTSLQAAATTCKPWRRRVNVHYTTADVFH